MKRNGKAGVEQGRGLNPVEKINRDMKIVSLLKEVRRPLPTTFRKSYGVSLPVELCELLSRLRSEYNVNVSAGLEEPIKRWAVKLAHGLNKNCQKAQQNGVDSQPRP